MIRDILLYLKTQGSPMGTSSLALMYIYIYTHVECWICREIGWSSPQVASLCWEASPQILRGRSNRSWLVRCWRTICGRTKYPQFFRSIFLFFFVLSAFRDYMRLLGWKKNINMINIQKKVTWVQIMQLSIRNSHHLRLVDGFNQPLWKMMEWVTVGMIFPFP